MRLKLSAPQEDGDGSQPEPLIFAKSKATPPRLMIGLQTLTGLAGLILGAHLFVTATESMAGAFAISPLLLALLIAPLATELPEMSNSFLWLYRKKDRLAVANVTGAMVFQGTIPVSVGLIGTDWVITASASSTMVLALQAASFYLLQLFIGGYWRAWLLGSGALLYVGYTVYLALRP
jgi:cation:H+ antiporter